MPARKKANLPEALAAASALGIQPNLVDKAIATFAPSWAVSRLANRGMLALNGGYNGARIDKAQLSRWLTHAGSPTTDIIRDLPQLRSRSRDQMRNAPIALGALETTVSHVVGTGLSLSPAIDAEFLSLADDAAEEWQDDVGRRWAAWAGSLDCDLSRRLNFYGIQELGFRSALESGDSFVFTPRVARAGGPERLALQLVEADRVSNPQLSPNTPGLIDGIEIDPITSEPIACHVARFHPGDAYGYVNVWDRRTFRGSSTGRQNVLHLYRPLRPNQVRGVPWIAPVLEPLKQLSRFTEAELNAAVSASIMSVFIKMDPEAFQDLYNVDAQGAVVDEASRWSGEMESSKAVNLLPGESIETPSPGRPNPEFDPFVQAIMRQIGVALQLPYEVLTMHYQSSYSAARASLLMAWKFFRSRRDWLATYLCQPVYELWLSEEIAGGRITAPGFFENEVLRAAWCSASWVGDGPGSIDPAKEVAAARERVEMEISTLQAESILHDGRDWEPKHRQRVKEMAAQKADGTYVPAAGAPAPAPEVAPPDPANAAIALAAQESAAAMSRMAATQAAIADRPQQPASISVTTPPVEVHNHVAPAAVTVQPAALTIHNEVQPTPVSVIAEMPEPTVILNHPAGATAVHERDPSTQEILRTVTTFAAAPR